MKNILIISGHPDLKTSVANAAILAQVERELPEAQIRKLDALYPDKRFDIAAEQDALLNADVIVFQFPFSWYAMPGLMKLWLDEVFLHGFSHGSKGKLGGKKLLLSFTTGAPAAAYQKDGVMQHEIAEYLPQFKTTAALCNLDYQGEIYTTGVSYSARATPEAQAEQEQKAREHGERLVAKLKELAA
ncbi:General stress protein 14 [Kingella potus]|uniref:General stress protein 14 n=1 Tax=Kingella potus TaxID=265175 RepID=A0A377R3H4_9NEIS|nr:NAD(P)H-dependent oxidoreductase [Kingella potus]UOP00411.1 NAD(P)H-dependent oxidoreductase [Kingella potus]STR02522.1 General stress protein 14 [Kingella potus]